MLASSSFGTGDGRYVQGAGAHSYWRRPAGQRQKKRGKIYLRQIAVQIQRQIEREG